MNELIHCAKCKNEELQQTKKARTRTVAGHTFQAELEALSCPSCGATHYSAQTMGEFEMAIAVWLAEHGVNDGEAVRLMRNVLELKGSEFAALLDVMPETLSRWEKEHQPPDRMVAALLASMVLDQKAGHEQTLQRLRTLQHPPQKTSLVETEILLWKEGLQSGEGRFASMAELKAEARRQFENQNKAEEGPDKK